MNITNEFLNYEGLQEYNEKVKRYIEEKTPQSDWAQTDSTKADFIKNKPELENVAYINSIDNENITDANTDNNTSAVLYVQQNLTESEKAQARANIGIIGTGKDGVDGTSVTVTNVSESTADGGSNVVTFSDGKTLTVKNGSTGVQGEKGDKGDPYTLTEADKAELVSTVLANFTDVSEVAL